MSVASAQQKSNGVSPGTSIVITFDNPVVSGSLITINIKNHFTSLGSQIYSVSDNKGNIYDQTVESGTSGQFSTTQFFSYNVIGGVGFEVTITWTDSGEVDIDGAEWSGVSSSSPLVSSSPASGVGVLNQTDSLNPAFNGLFLAGFVDNQGAAYSNLSAGWNEINKGAGFASAYLVGAGAQQAGFDLSANSAWWNVIAFYKEATSSPSTLIPATSIDAKRF